MEQAISIPRIPSIVNGIQVNFCKNPNCLNYGRPASEASQPRGKKSINGYTRETDTYKLSGNRDGRIALYSPYNPIIVGKLLDIFRVFYNFAEIGDDKRTPAMRLRLVGGPVTLSQILA